jgi:hypothetical protein
LYDRTVSRKDAKAQSSKEVRKQKTNDAITPSGKVLPSFAPLRLCAFAGNFLSLL